MARREVLDDPVIDVFRALFEPIRVDIMTKILNTKEPACAAIREIMPGLLKWLGGRELSVGRRPSTEPGHDVQESDVLLDLK